MTKHRTISVIIDSIYPTGSFDVKPTAFLVTALFKALGLSKPYPYAAFFQQDNENKNTLCLTPLSLAVGMHDILIQGLLEQLDVSLVEYKQIVTLIKPLICDLGLNFHENDRRLFISGDFNLITTPYFELAVSPIKSCLPNGPDRALFNRLMAECQMLLSQADFNQDRIDTGQLPINSLWCWGEGTWAFSDNKLALVTDCDYLQNQIRSLAHNNILLLSQQSFLEIKKNDLPDKLVIYLSTVDEVTEKKLEQINKYNELNYVWKNVSYLKPKRSFLRLFRR